MKKIILSGVLLTAFSLPAVSGPILNGIISDEMSWEADGHDITGGAETYSNLSIDWNGRKILAQNMQLSEVDGSIQANFEGLSFLPGMAEATRIERGSLAVSRDFFQLGPRGVKENLMKAISAAPSADQSCHSFDLPASVSAHNIIMDGNPTLEITIGSFASGYSITDPEGDCLLDAGMDISDVRISEQASGVSAEFDSIGLSAYWSLLNGRAPENIGARYTASGDVAGVHLQVGGTDQIQIRNISFSNAMSAVSLKAMIEAGYFDAYYKIAKSELSGESFDLSEISVPKIWNALRTVDAEGALVIDGVDIIGELAEGISGMGLLSRGRNLDASFEYVQRDTGMKTALAIESEGVLKADLELRLVAEHMDEALHSMGPAAMLTSPPIALNSVSVSLIDETFSETLKDDIGVDLYSEIGQSVSAMIGQTKGQIIQTWFERAQMGGTEFFANPKPDLNVMQAFIGFMGDWGAFGDVLNVQTNQE